MSDHAIGAELGIKLHLQSRDAKTSQTSLEEIELAPARLAVVMVDVWTQHPCKGATDWPARMIPAWNEFLNAVRALDIQVIFASAGDDLKRWEGKPPRTSVTGLPNVAMPKSNGFLADHGMLGPWASGCMCPITKLVPGTDEPLIECKRQELLCNQDPRIVVRDNDMFIAAGHYVPENLPSAIASWGQPAQQELWNICQARGITHILYIGDATNMCVINREFAMIQARRLGLNSIIVRDLTNAMTFYGYNPDTKKLDPTLTPAVGTAKSVEYIEEKIGPSIDSGQLLAQAAKLPNAKVRARNNYLPVTDYHYRKTRTYIEPVAVPDYDYASEQAYENFNDLKYGVRLHWGLYTLWGINASWPLILEMDDKKRAEYFDLYKQFNPTKFDADSWMNLFADNGVQMFALTTKHHDGFSLFDTKTRVKQRVNWTAPGGPVIEDCDAAFSVMESPFKRDIIREICDAARKRDVKIDLYFSHPDWHDADFRMYGYHPMMTPEGKDVLIPGEFEDVKRYHGGNFRAMGPNHTPEQRQRLIERHRAQLKELLTHYGKINMVCLDQWMAGDIWPEMRRTMLELRKIQPDVMFRARGIGNYGDYYTNEGFIPGGKDVTNMPWFVTNTLTPLPSYDANVSKFHDANWMVQSLVDSVSKGGNFMAGFGPDEHGEFHPKVIEVLKDVGAWLKLNGEAIYATRARDGALWKDGDNVRFTRTKDRKVIYAICLKWPGKSLPLATVMPSDNAMIRMIGYDKPLSWQHSGKGIAVEIPEQLQEEANRPCKYAWVVKINATDAEHAG